MSDRNGHRSARRLDYICLQPTRQGQASYAHVNEIIAGLRRRGWNVRLVEPTLPRPGRADSLRRLAAAAWAQARYWAATRLSPAPVVYIRGHFLAFPTAALARIRGSAVIQEINGPGEDVYDAWPVLRHARAVLSLVARAQLRWADAVVVVTPGLGDLVRANADPRAAIHVIGNGADVDRFTPTAKTDYQHPRPYVVFVGALASWQGIDVVLDAAASPGWPESVDVLIAGDGKERDRVQAAAAANPRVRWLGSVPYHDAAGLTAASLAALVPMNAMPRSRHGLSPLKLFEGMAAGVPVLASDLPGLTEIVKQHENGILFPPGDAPALARAVCEIHENRARAKLMGERGRAAAVAKYSWDARAAATEEVILGIINARSRSAAPCQ